MYQLNALISAAHVLDGTELEAVTLPRGLVLAPLTSGYWKSTGHASKPILREQEGHAAPDSDFDGEGPTRAEFIERAASGWRRISALCTELSSEGPIAYVEAEFFGGVGAMGCGQAAAVWHLGELTMNPIVAADAINQALRVIGVATKPGLDEFATLGLDKYRRTEEWSRSQDCADS